MKRPCLVGVTGGIGSGKSTLCRFLSEMGCALFEADRVAKELQRSDPVIIAGIRRLFGDDIYAPDASGSLQPDRRRIAREVFSDPDKLRALNAIMHPGVNEAFHDMLEQVRQKGTPVFVKEAAILFEAGRTEDLDMVVVVAADMELRIQRAVDKGLGNREEVLQRIAAQWPQEKLVAKADYVVYNEGSLEELRRETEKLYAFILRRSSSLRERR
ncbi:MAG: dephospho-CoA kinase [Chlorobi bacterium]|nr:dephospho-CoA kinase [Chlorobiota bacterium]